MIIITLGRSLRNVLSKPECLAEAKLKMQGVLCILNYYYYIISAKSLLARHLIRGDRPNTADLGFAVMTDLSEGFVYKVAPH